MKDSVLTDLDYADDFALLADTSDKLCDALSNMEKETAKFGLCVS